MLQTTETNTIKPAFDNIAAVESTAIEPQDWKSNGVQIEVL